MGYQRYGKNAGSGCKSGVKGTEIGGWEPSAGEAAFFDSRHYHTPQMCCFIFLSQRVSSNRVTSSISVRERPPPLTTTIRASISPAPLWDRRNVVTGTTVEQIKKTNAHVCSPHLELVWRLRSVSLHRLMAAHPASWVGASCKFSLGHFCNPVSPPAST